MHVLGFNTRQDSVLMMKMKGGKATTTKKRTSDPAVHKCCFMSEDGNDLIVHSMRCRVLMSLFHKDDASWRRYSLNSVLPLYF